MCRLSMYTQFLLQGLSNIMFKTFLLIEQIQNSKLLLRNCHNIEYRFIYLSKHTYCCSIVFQLVRCTFFIPQKQHSLGLKQNWTTGEPQSESRPPPKSRPTLGSILRVSLTTTFSSSPARANPGSDSSDTSCIS